MKAQFEVDPVLWGKVRVASLYAGKSIGELLEPMLVKNFGGPTKEMVDKGVVELARISVVESGKPVVGLGANRMSSQGGSTPPSGAKPVVGQSGDAGTCSMCGKTGVKTAMNKDRKWVCYECAGVKS